MTDANQLTGPAWMRWVLEQYERPLTRYAARITGDADRARDVVQETFLRLCKEDRTRVDGRLAEWLFTVCRSRALDVLRKEGRMKPLAESTAQAPESADGTPPVVAERREAAGEALRILATLPANQQEVIRLRFQNALSYKEISKVTNLSVSNVGYLIHTAIKTMRELMAASATGE